jgi:hypothetical protein
MLKDSTIHSQQERISSLEKETAFLKNEVSTKNKQIEKLELQRESEMARKEGEIRRLRNSKEVTTLLFLYSL